MVTTEKKLAVQELASNILRTKLDAIDRTDIELAKNRIIDIVGCALGGAHASGNSGLIELVKQWGGRKEATIWGHGIKSPAHNVAMVNSVLCRSYDYEVSGAYVEGKSFPGHQPSVTVPTALAMAEFKDVSGKDLLTALIVGDDALCRIIAAGDYSMASPWDCTGTFHKFGATAIAGRLLGLTEQQMANAFGIAVDTVASSFQSLWDGVETFKLHGALACRDGIFSAELASNGFTGLKDPLSSKLGFFPVFCQSYLTQFPDILTKDLGRKFYSGGGIGHKPYPCCHGNHAAIECALQIVQQHNIDPQDVTEVVLSVSPRQADGFLNQPYASDVACQTKATFNLPYNIANVLMRKSVTKLEHFSDEAVHDLRVIELANKVKIVPLPSPLTGMGTGVESEMATGMIVKMADGKEFSAHADVSKGRKGRELNKEEIKDKFWANVAFSKIISVEKAKDVLNMLDHLDEVSNFTKVIRLLVR